VQPYLSQIDAAGEVAVMYIGGVYSHSIRRRALLNVGASPDQAASLPLNVQAHEPLPQERALAERVIRHLMTLATELLYARIDLVPAPSGEPLILEVELTEPSLFLDCSNAGAERLADAINDRLQATLQE